MTNIPTQDDFHNEIIKRQNEAREAGLKTIQINALELHKSVGYDSSNHRMPMACQAMYDVMTKKDVIIEKPPKGKGTRLTIQYHL
jgi:hypothetical protein